MTTTYQERAQQLRRALDDVIEYAERYADLHDESLSGVCREAIAKAYAALAGAPPPDDPLRAPLEAVTDLLESAHDTHIFSPDDEHPADCEYCRAIKDARAALATMEPDPQQIANEDALAGRIGQ